MAQLWIPSIFYRGGSSKGVFFDRAKLPADRDAIAPILLQVLGSPDAYGRQLNGMGGGVSSLSKAVMLSRSTRADADIDYLFAQVAVDKPIVDWGANCGNLSSAVGPCAIELGLIAPGDGEALVRIYQVNTDKIIHARFAVAGGLPVTQGDFAIGGVSGSGARIALDFLDPGGAATRGFLPTGAACESLETESGERFTVSMVDATNPVVFVEAAALGIAGSEDPDTLEAVPRLMERIDAIRRAAGVRMGLSDTPGAVGLGNPKVALLAAPAPFVALDGRSYERASHDLTVRMVSMERIHRAVTLTGAMCTAAACHVEGTLAQALCGGARGEIRLGNPSGILPASAQVTRQGDGWHVAKTTAYRTARSLMRGEVSIAGENT